MKMKIIEQANCWRLITKTMSIDIDYQTGSPGNLKVLTNGEHLWTNCSGDIQIRDDLKKYCFNHHDLLSVVGKVEDNKVLTLQKKYRGANWILDEKYSVENDIINWNARLIMENGNFRSAAITWKIPWPEHLYPFKVWAARHNMPQDICQTASEWLEYGEVTCGIAIPAASFYHPGEKWGFALCKPFEQQTPQFRIGVGYREPDMRVCFDRLALYPEHNAEAAFSLWGTEGCWRPALGKIFEQNKKYFVSKSELLPKLWGGHNCSRYKQTEEDIATGAKSGEKWCEIHAHFPLYGQYDAQEEKWTAIDYAWHQPPEDDSPRRSETTKTAEECQCSVKTVRKTIDLLNKYNIAAMPYVQVSGDANPPVAERFAKDQIRDINGKPVKWREMGTSVLWQMNASADSAFGKHLDEMIDGMLDKYVGNKGVFVDQACYNFVDTAHFDGITAIDNRPANMTGFNFAPRLAKLSERIHPDGAIMANGPFGIEILKNIDGFMSEGNQKWLCDHFQYYGLAKPMYCLLYKANRANVEMMFQHCLIYAAGHTASGWANEYQDLYDAYLPLIEMLAERGWVFDPDPLTLPTGYEGNIYRGKEGDILVTLVKTQSSAIPGKEETIVVTVRTKDIDFVKDAEWRNAGDKKAKPVKCEIQNHEVTISIPADLVIAGILKLK